MNPFIWRALLGGLLLATAADRILRADASQPDIRSKVIGLVALKDWSPLELSPDPGDPLGMAIRFKAAGCDGIGHIFFVDLALQTAPLVNQVVGPGYTWQVAYLGRTWSHPDRLGLRLEWLKERTLSLLGLGQYTVNEVALMIGEPPGCRILNETDWSPVWRTSSRSHLTIT